MRLVLLMAFSSACSLFSTPCDNAGLDAVIDALGAAPGEMRASLAIAGVAEACPGPDLAAPLQAPPDMRAVLLARYVQDNPGEWEKGCPAGMDALKGLATAAPATRPAMLFRSCELSRHGWTEAEAERMGDYLLPAVLVAGRLQAAEAGRREKILRALVP